MGKNLVVDAIDSGRMLPEDFQKIPGVQQVRDLTRDVFPRFRKWRKSARVYFHIYRNPYAMDLYDWEMQVLQYVRNAVKGVLRGDEIYTYYMCAMAYHNLTAMRAFLRDRPKHWRNLHYKIQTPDHALISHVDRLLAQEASGSLPEKSLEDDNPSISDEFVSEENHEDEFLLLEDV